MKYSALFLGGVLLALSACSDDKSYLPSLNEAADYSGSNLKVYYCGEQMPAKKVTYTPSEADKLKGELSCSGITDLSQLSSVGLSGIGSAPGVLPGSPSLTLPVTLSQKEDTYVFSGSGETPFVSSFSYAGKLQADSCVLNLKDVKLADLSLAGSIWAPAPIKQDGLSFSSLPFRLVWEIDPAIGIDLDLSALLRILATTPFIPVYNHTAYSSIAQLYNNALQTVAFNENGNIFVRYYSSVGGATQLVTSVGNTLQYVVPQPNTLLLYPNPTTIFGRWLVAQSNPGDDKDISFASSRADDSESPDADKQLLLAFLKGLIPMVLENSENGFPFTVERTDSSLSLYLDTPVVLALLGEVVKVLEENPEILNQLLQKVGVSFHDPDIQAQLAELLPKLKTILLNTTKVQLGLNFEAYK